MISSNPFHEAIIKGKPLLLDGAMGSYIQQKGFETDDILWTTNINYNNPDPIIKIHCEYVDAGADIITTNTFRTNPASLEARGLFNSSDYVKQAVKLAKDSVSDKEILIAGSNVPAEDCYQTERTLSKQKLEINHKEHIDLLIDSGVDFILNETQSQFDEFQVICEHCALNELPYSVSLFLTDSLTLLSGESIEFVLNYLKNLNLLSLGINCIDPKLFLKIIGSIKLPRSWGFYLNCGSGNPADKIIKCGVTPEEYLKCVEHSLPYSPSFVGSCCGSNPSHTNKIREYLDGKHSS